MIVNVDFKKAGIEPIHELSHAQVAYVVSGKFEVSIDAETKILKGSDCFYIKPYALLGATCLEDGVLIECFHSHSCRLYEIVISNSIE